MKKSILLSSIAFLTMLFLITCFSDKTIAQTGSEQSAVLTKPIPMAAPAMKQQNTQQNKSSNAESAPKSNTKKTNAPVDNKIAISDPGAPSEKSSTKSTAPATKKSSKNTTAVSPK